jgi:bifunctional enzyme CysN/CysC
MLGADRIGRKARRRLSASLADILRRYYEKAAWPRRCGLSDTPHSGPGKSTIASILERKLNERGCHTYLVDGDNVRGGLNRDLGLTEADRVENVRRVPARLFVDAGLIVVASMISPYRSDRLMVRERVREDEFTPLDVYKLHDPKGLYAKATRGGLVNFTRIDSPYEAPLYPELRLVTVGSTADALAHRVIDCLRAAGTVHA